MKDTGLRLIKNDALSHASLPTPSGEELFSTVVKLTGLPEEQMTEELSQILENKGCSSHSMTIEDLRTAVLAYLESLHHEFGETLSPDAPH